LTASDKPEAEFDLGGEKPIAAYEMCNLHGFWKAEI
jgi:superoxide reductase